MDNKQYFFGSKLNTALLLILIILMVIALRWISQDKKTYLPVQQKIKSEQINLKPEIACGTDQSVKITSPNGETFKISQKIHISWSTCNIDNDGLGEYAIIMLKRFDLSGKELLPSINIADSSDARIIMPRSGYLDWTIPEYETFVQEGTDGNLIPLYDSNVKYKIYINITTKVFERGTPDYKESESAMFSILR